MKLLFMINLLALSLLLQGCKTLHPMRMSAIPNDQQEEFVVEGKEAVSSVKTHYVSLSPYREFCSATGKTSYVLFVQNMGKEKIEFGPQNVNIEFHDKTNGLATKSIQLQTYNEILGEIETKERNKKNALTWAAVGAANIFSAVSDFISNDDEKDHANKNSNASKVQANLIASERVNSEALSPELAQKNDESFRHFLNQFSNQAKSKRDILDNVFMTSQTIQPGQHHGGLIVSNTKVMNQTEEGVFTMTVMVGGESHVFSVDRRFP